MFNKSDTILVCLNCIRNVLKFIKNIESGIKDVPNASSVVMSELEKNGLVTRLEQICLYNNDQISKYAANLLEVVEVSLEHIKYC